MLDFLLVLGDVPGTSFQITFTEMLLACEAILCLELMHRHHAWIKQLNFRIKFWVYYSLARPSFRFKLPITLIGHIN